jgi:hypothetical protein
MYMLASAAYHTIIVLHEVVLSMMLKSSRPWYPWKRLVVDLISSMHAYELLIGFLACVFIY